MMVSIFLTVTPEEDAMLASAVRVLNSIYTSEGDRAVVTAPNEATLRAVFARAGVTPVSKRTGEVRVSNALGMAIEATEMAEVHQIVCEEWLKQEGG